jgi:putative mycofactocin binding protein MftB
MSLRLATDVQVRQESWGLLFYRQAGHKLCFVKSGDWLRPAHFNGTWTQDAIANDVSRRTGAPPETVARALPRLAGRLIKNRVISDEIR